MGKKVLKRIAIVMCALAVSIASLFGCMPTGGGDEPPQPQNYGSYTGINDKIVDFSKGDGSDVFRKSNGYGNGGMFDCRWSNGNVVYDDDKDVLRLRLTGDNNTVYGSEVQSNGTYGYGYYSVRMKAIKREGVVSSFFTYTRWPQWDEIDIEFLGKDTTKVQFNYFTNGVGKHEKLYDLGFDASEGYHEYGFKWEEDKITWYVDGKGVYRATASIPSHDGRIMMNVWNGKSEGEDSVKNWLGTFDKSNFPVPDAEYKWVGYRPLGSEESVEHTVTFHSGEGTFAASESGIRQTVDGKVTPPSVTPPVGKKLKGWYDKATGGNKIDFNTKTFTDDADVYAQYESASQPTTEYTVTFHSGEGTFAASENGIRQTVDGKVTPPSVTPPVGKKLKGWYDKATGGNKLDLDTKIFTKDADVYAQYETELTVPQTGWVNISVNGFDGWGNYTVSKSNGLTISHSAKPDAWASCGMNLTVKYTYVKFTVTNGGKSSANFRLDIKKDGEGKGAVAEVMPSSDYNDYDRGVAIYNLAVGASVDIVCKLDDGNAADRLIVMLNSFGDSAAATGSVTVTGLMGIPVGGTETPDYGSYTGVNDKIADFTYNDQGDNFERADWSNGGMFDCTWTPYNIYHDQSTQSLHLSITNSGNGYNAGEYRTKQKYSYGYFATCMKAVKKDGVVTSLFTYTGPSDNTEWHEIDIEFLGNDTTKVQFNYYTNGVGGHEYLYDLGFDASESFHEYGFKWEDGRITWYVDGVGVYSATTDIPSIPGKIMINAWPGKSEGADNVVDWSGRFDGTFPVPDAEYKWISYKAI